MSPFELPEFLQQKFSIIEDLTIHTNLDFYTQCYTENGDARLAMDAIQFFKTIPRRTVPYLRYIPRGCGSTYSAIHYSIYRMMNSPNRLTLLYACISSVSVRLTMQIFLQELNYAISVYNEKVLSAFGDSVHITQNNNTVSLVTAKTGIVISSIQFVTCSCDSIIRGRTSNEFIVDSVFRDNQPKEIRKIIENNIRDMAMFSNITGHRLVIFQGGATKQPIPLFDDGLEVKTTSIGEILHINPIQYQHEMLNRLGDEQYALQCLCTREVFNDERRI